MLVEGTLRLLQAQPVVLVATCFVFGLLVGSFLNVVIYRIPKMLEINWRREAQEFLELPVTASERFNLIKPDSRCPHCQHQIRWYENIPVVSWLVLRGKCSACSASISPRYPAIELTAALMAAVSAWTLGYGPWLLAVLGAGWCLLALTMIDYDTTLLPDNLTLPLMWAGLLLALMQHSPIPLPEAVTGAIAGYLSLWSVYWLFKLVTGKEGMGHGDFKLLAALGAWLGWKMLPLVILLSSVVGTIVAIVLMATGLIKRDQAIPFGPYLATAGWIALLWGHDIVSRYLGLFSF